MATSAFHFGRCFFFAGHSASGPEGGVAEPGEQQQQPGLYGRLAGADGLRRPRMASAKVPSHAIPEQRLQQARTFKEEGNHCYKEGRFRDAVSRYHWALLQIKGLDPNMPFPLQEFMADKPAMTADQEKELYTIRCDCYNNLAACLLQMPPVNYERVKDYSLKVLERQADNVKALYRAGVAFYHLGNYDKAQHYLLSATSRQPKDANVKRYLQLTKSQLGIYLQQEKQLYMGMFG